MGNLKRIFTAAAAMAAISAPLAGHALPVAESSPSNITADRDANGNIICGTWDYGHLNHEGGYGYGLIYIDCVYPNYPKGSPKF